jgi:hypothetical protein
MRRLLVIVLLVALASATAAAAAERNPRAERERLTAADNALARSVAVGRRDLGAGWTALPANREDEPPCRSFNPDLSRYTLTGKAETGFVEARGSTVQSLVGVFPSRRQAAGDFAASMRPGMAGCLREGIALAAKNAPDGVTFRVRSTRMVAAPTIGERSAAYRLVGTVTAHGASLSFHVDAIAVLRGRTIALVMFTGLERAVAGQRELLRAVASRMR